MTVAVFLVIQGCILKTQEAIKYNDTIVEYGNKVTKLMIDLGKAFERADPDEMDEKLEAVQDQIDRSIEGVENMDGFEDNYEFRDAAIDLLEFYQSVAENECYEIVDILKKDREDINEADVEYIKEVQEDLEAGEDELYNELVMVQKEFAKKYNFIIENKSKYRFL